MTRSWFFHRMFRIFCQNSFSVVHLCTSKAYLEPIYDEAFLQKYLTAKLFSQKGFIVDLQLGSKYVPVQLSLKLARLNNIESISSQIHRCCKNVGLLINLISIQSLNDDNLLKNFIVDYGVSISSPLFVHKT